MLTVREFSFNDSIDWNLLLNACQTATFFQTKEWLQLWTKHFGGNNVKLFGVFDAEEIIGIVPLFLQDQTIQLLGTSPVLGKEFVSDFGDIIVKRGREIDVWKSLLSSNVMLNSTGYRPVPVSFQHLKQTEDETLKQVQGDNKKEMNLRFIREDSPSFKILQELGGKVEETDVAPYIDLPKTWEEYLSSLDRHDRHELRRKMRKLEAEGAAVRHSDGNKKDIDEFFRLMRLSNEQKRDFLSDAMRLFFTDLIESFLPEKILRLWFLTLDGKAIASILTFEYHNEVLLYNSGFDPAYNKLSPGFILKAYAIKDAIVKGKRRFDFLRGDERYKFDLGGKARKLYTIKLT